MKGTDTLGMVSLQRIPSREVKFADVKEDGANVLGLPRDRKGQDNCSGNVITQQCVLLTKDGPEIHSSPLGTPPKKYCTVKRLVLSKCILLK